MAVSPLRSVSEAPRDRAEFDAWMERQAQALASKLNASLDVLMRRTIDHFMRTVEIESVTASADLGAFDSIPSEWLAIMEADVLPALQGVYLSGNLTAFVTAAEAIDIPARFLSQWSTVVNSEALDYIRDASNRLVGVGDAVWSDIRLQATRALQTGMSHEDLKQQIEKFGFTEYRADTIARTEMNSAYSRGDWDGAQALGEFGPVEKVWVAAIDSRTRPAHVAAHDQVRLFSQPFDVGGTAMMYPHDSAGGASNVVNCRCHLENLHEGDERPDGSIVTRT